MPTVTWKFFLGIELGILFMSAMIYPYDSEDKPGGFLSFFLFWNLITWTGCLILWLIFTGIEVR